MSQGMTEIDKDCRKVLNLNLEWQIKWSAQIDRQGGLPGRDFRKQNDFKNHKLKLIRVWKYNSNQKLIMNCTRGPSKKPTKEASRKDKGPTGEQVQKI